jgi:hypothetical protein
MQPTTDRAGRHAHPIGPKLTRARFIERTLDYAETREDAMAAFAKSWRRE